MYGSDGRVSENEVLGFWAVCVCVCVCVLGELGITSEGGGDAGVWRWAGGWEDMRVLDVGEGEIKCQKCIFIFFGRWWWWGGSSWIGVLPICQHCLL